MSRIAKKPIKIKEGISVKYDKPKILIKGKLGEGEIELNSILEVDVKNDVIEVRPLEDSKKAWAQAGTARTLINNLLDGVSNGFSRRLQLVGVGYRAQAKGSTLNLNLGFSHPVEYKMPEGVSVETPSQTEILLKCANKQLLGQTAANIRSFRKPEPYKGKGIRYSDENIKRKEAKKK